MAKNPKKPISPTKKHLARLERERRQTRFIMIGAAVVIVSVLVLIVIGILNQTVLAARRPVAVVNGEPIRTDHFQNQTRYMRYLIVANALNTYQMAQYFGQDPTMAGSFVSQLQQFQSQLAPTTVGNQVLESTIDDFIIRQEAERLGITVTEAEVEQAFQAAFGYFPNGTPTPSPTFKQMPTSTYSAAQLTFIPPTATETLTPTLTATSTLTPTQTLPPTQTPTQLPPTEVVTLAPGITLTATITPTETPLPTSTFTSIPTDTSTPTASATFTPAPSDTSTPTPIPSASNTPTPYTTEGYGDKVSTAFFNLDTAYGINADMLRYALESQLIREKVMKAVLGDIAPTEEQVWAQHILVQDEALAKDIRSRLEEGEDWGLMAATYSTDESNKNSYGDLGWFGRGAMVKEFEDAAFALKEGETSQPVKSQFGWHIIRLVGRENHPISPEAYQQLKETKFEEWLKAQRDAGKIEINDFWINVVPETPTLPDEIIQFILANSQPPAQPPVITPEQ